MLTLALKSLKQHASMMRIFAPPSQRMLLSRSRRRFCLSLASPISVINHLLAADAAAGRHYFFIIIGALQADYQPRQFPFQCKNRPPGRRGKNACR